MAFGFTTFSQDSFSSSGDTSISIVVSATGVAGTGQIGNAHAGQFVTVLPTGVQGQAQVGNLGLFATGVYGTISLGPYSIATESNVTIILETPVTGTTHLGNETLSLDCVLTMTGVQANASVNSVGFKIDVSTSVTGVTGNTSLGSGSTVHTGVTSFPSGVSTSTAIGTVGISLSADVDVTGVYASVSTSNVLVWSEIDTNQDPNWVEIAA